MTPVRHVVLVHGAWHGAWCFSALQAELDRRGVPSLAIDLPGHGASTLPLSDMHGDAQHVVDTLAALRSRGIENVVLAGHSYGGAVISQAASTDPSINHLVYIAAFAPEAGQSVMAQLMALPRHDTALGGAMIVGIDGNSTINPEFAKDSFYGCCNDEVIAASIARLSPQPMVTMTQEVTGSPRDTISSTYVLCSQDQAVHPEHQKIMSQLCNNLVTLDTDHSPFVSMVKETADILERIANS
jgi:pimeloyl-ACP methyl ester carboxylesterase